MRRGDRAPDGLALAAVLLPIRRGVPGDAARLSAFAAESFRRTFAESNTPDDMAAYLATAFSPEIQRRELIDPDAMVFLAETRDEIVGYAYIQHGNDGCELKRLYVADAWKGQGLARHLVEAAQAGAAERGAERLWLGVWEKNPRAIAFYSKMGFVPVGSHVFQLGSDAQTDILMELRLPG